LQSDNEQEASRLVATAYVDAKQTRKRQRVPRACIATSATAANTHAIMCLTLRRHKPSALRPNAIKHPGTCGQDGAAAKRAPQPPRLARYKNATVLYLAAVHACRACDSPGCPLAPVLARTDQVASAQCLAAASSKVKCTSCKALPTATPIAALCMLHCRHKNLSGKFR
jgi:hypothetical protein